MRSIWARNRYVGAGALCTVTLPILYLRETIGSGEWFWGMRGGCWLSHTSNGSQMKPQSTPNPPGYSLWDSKQIPFAVTV